MSKQTILDRLYPTKRVEYRGVTFIVKPLHFHEVPALIAVMPLVRPVISSGIDATEQRGSFYLAVSIEFIGQMNEQVVQALDQCVEIEGLDADEQVSVRDLPLDAIPCLIEAFLEQNLCSGNWETLGRRLAANVVGQNDESPSPGEMHSAS